MQRGTCRLDYVSRRVLQAIGQKGSSSKVPSAAEYGYLLRQSCIAHSLPKGKHIHAHVVRSGLVKDMFVGNHLAMMYGNCGDMHEANMVFQKLSQRNVFSWTIMLGIYCRHGLARDAVELFHQMQLDGVIPDKPAFVTILDACTRFGSLAKGKFFHAYIIISDFDSYEIVGNAILNMYSKLGVLEYVESFFCRMRNKNIVSWTSMIVFYSETGDGRKALSYFHEMQLEGILPDKVTYSSLVEACISEEALAQGKRIHSCIRKSGLDSGIVLATALMNLYNICGWSEEGHRIFDKMQGRNLVSWNSILSSFCWQGNPKETLHILLEMEAEGLMPNNVTCVSIVGMFANTEVLSGTKWIHSYAICRNLDPDMLVGNALIDSYGKCGSLEYATQVFDHMPNQNVVSWSTIIAGFSQQDQGKITLYIFQQMNLEGVLPNGITFISLLYACISDGDISEGKRIHAFILDRGLEYDMVVSNALINMYGKCGSLDMAQGIFDGMHEPDVISWTALLSSYIQHGYHKNAALLLQKMQTKDVVPDEFVYASIIDACASAAVLAEAKWMHALLVDNHCESFSDVEHALVNMYGKCGSLGDAQRMFQKVDTQNIISWTAMIATYAQHNCAKEALQLFEEMQNQGMMPNRVTFLSIIDACADQAALHEGMEMHTRVRECGLDEEIIIGNALINMYGKCGSLRRAQITFSEMPEHNIISWNTIVGAYAQHGFYKEALGLFQQMHFDGQMPNDVTLVNTISACSRAGLVDEACYLFVSARRVYALALIVEHYNCMFDVLGRAGMLDEINDFIHNMVLLPTPTSWTAFLGACVMHGDMEQAKFAAKCAVESDPKKAGPYVLLSNICAVPSDEWAGID